MENQEKAVENQKSGLCTAGLVLGIIGLCTSIIPIINNLSFVMGLLAIIFALLSLKKASKGKLIATVILGVLAIVVTLSSQKALSDSLDALSDELDKSFSDVTGDNTEEILANDLSVEIGEFVVEEGEYFNDAKLTVKLTNKTSEIKSFSVLIEAVDIDGNRITETTVYANSLNPNQSVEEEAFTIETSEVVEKLKTATFKVVEASKY